jgi:hypothetical protein
MDLRHFIFLLRSASCIFSPPCYVTSPSSVSGVVVSAALSQQAAQSARSTRKIALGNDPDDEDSLINRDWHPLVVPLHKHQVVALIFQGISDVPGCRVADTMSQRWYLWGWRF